jgi:hypothetical protein
MFKELTDELLDLGGIEKGYKRALLASSGCCCCCCSCSGGGPVRFK